ncbi:D-alanine--D-alanine ligase [Kosmotoga sp.]|jgi:D-alanine-D-alanine ligase|uniref:D-alanine--D-alanine ligase n=1 Tax=Kosmotoga sp. TaxID=1955248 RepID=UPI0024AA4F0A|nr:D-alanine--D-alanine ligase [Kosmotoga sp.]MDI3523780.1 D-alanine-D-alanine ligase [Kosmotoga sp.]MDK2953324.1 D-alanine-D-alanine ligase [Kosmotoga sp.]
MNELRRRITVLYGGLSKERPISLKSGSNVINALEKLGYIVDAFDLRPDNIAELAKLRDTDLVFIALHGKFGEDGKIQSLLELFGIEYIGSDSLVSAICFNKNLTYKLLSNTIAMPRWKTITSEEELEGWKHFPAVIKPANEGSSIGVYICDTFEELQNKTTKVLKEYKTLILEEYIKGRELTISIIEKGGQPVVLPILELKPKRRFYDYEAKYTAGLTEFIVPAPMDDKLKEEIEKLSKRIFNALGCRHFARIDGILKENQFYFLEVNTIPGLTDLSDLPVSARAAGMGFEELIDLIVKEALKPD